jgi:hypothetical protein
LTEIMANSTAFGSMPRHGDDETASRQPYQIAITAVFLCLSIPAVVLRLWVRRWTMAALGMDDYMMILALVRPSPVGAGGTS